MMLAGINTVITTTNEFISRTIQTPITGSKHKYGFLVQSRSGGRTINMQSLINILMTLIVSLFGGPVFFIKSRMQRFIYFASFGLVASIAAQATAGILRDGVIFFAASRMMFDLCYTCSFKYAMFEFGRKPIVKLKQKVFKVSFIRINQDLFTTLFKVGLLNALGFHG